MARPENPIARQLQDLKLANGGYAYDIVNDRQPPSERLALRIFRATGHKFGPIAAMNDDDIEALARIKGV